jgi:hypothetical protein
MGQIRQLQERGAVSLREIANGLNERGIVAPRGGRWGAAQVKAVMDRCA